jgi:hypothetical protein
MRRVTLPGRVGWYAFRGFRRTSTNQWIEMATIFQIVRVPYNRELAVRLRDNVFVRLDMLDGEWWRVDLPWESSNNGGCEPNG